MANATAPSSEPKAKTAEPAAAQPSPVVIDLGKKKRGQVKKLRRGRGKLLDRVHDVLADIKSDGNVADGAQPVIVVVREKKKRGSLRIF